ncbi:hypothetical protein GTO10_02555 [Candidatus Saccharibacteria bacterium]|nr:hypothetical protein [Candidatus Saccharibacteria bacterium]
MGEFANLLGWRQQAALVGRDQGSLVLSLYKKPNWVYNCRNNPIRKEDRESDV